MGAFTKKAGYQRLLVSGKRLQAPTGAMPVPASKRLLQVLTSTQERFVLVFRLLLTKLVSEKHLYSMDVDELTSQVFRRGAIWDKRLNKI
ncbi:hypothetical protein J6590_092093 [Homalodisca vitripennis]|nr:hypothetical protein J6590_099115 [Homalodisca vitripennis]KAG8324446.1 hypothetical protein J6590_092093 [Homalodisca vitripennis]